MLVSENELLIKEWDMQKNSELGLDPSRLVVGSNKYAYWKCVECGNEWNAQIAKRGIRGQGCPICGAKKQAERRRVKMLSEQGSLASNCPNISLEWDFERNDKAPGEVLAGSNEKVYWICSKCGHNWQAAISKRTVRGQGCPICGKEKSIEGQIKNLKERIKREGSLGDEHPELVEEWNYELNEGSPYDYLPGSNISVNWICSKCGNRWKAIIANRAKGIGCIKCGRIQAKKSLLNNLIKEKGSLAINRPDIATEWDYDKNGNLTPADVMVNTNKSVWWLCSKCNYSWKTAVHNRTSGKGCPKCALIEQGIANATPIEGVNDLLSQAPNLAEEWHPERNGELTPADVARSSNRKVWWLGKCGHEWQATVGRRFSGSGCPQCLKEFKISYPEKVIFYYLDKYIDLDVKENYRPVWLEGKEIDIYIPDLKFGIEYDGSNWHKDLEADEVKNKICKDNGITLLRIREKGLALCQLADCFFINVTSDKDDELVKALDHIFEYIKTRFGITINYTVNLSVDRPKIYDLMEMNRKDNSLLFQYPDISKEWHPEKNGRLTPEYVNAHSHRKYWWICPKGHEYEMVVKHKIEKNTQCPICSNHRVLVGYNDLEFKRPDIAAQWAYEMNKDLLPSQVMEFSNRKVWWKCEKGHLYQRSIAHQSTRPDTGCPICKMQILCVGVNDIKTLFPLIAEEWDYESNEENRPEDFTPISHKRFNWICNKCGRKWNISINSRCMLGHGCPSCAGKKRWETRQKNTE